MRYNDVAINIYASVDNNIISRNTITGNRIGIQALVCHNNIIENNKIFRNTGTGIHLSGGHDNILQYNDITENGNGTILDWAVFFGPFICRDNSIIENNITNNHQYGLSLVGASFNTISGNKIVENMDGICLDDDVVNYEGMVYMPPDSNTMIRNEIWRNSRYGLQLINSSINIIFHNNLIKNGDHLTLENSNDIWHNGCEGNFWSNYSGTDLNGDGIGDTLLPWETVDNLPLMNPYWNPGDINHDLKVDIKDIAIAAKAYGTVPGIPYWNCHADITGSEYLVPDNQVDIRDIALIAMNYGKTYWY
jgi:parallel beta-helix repeat protein